MMNRVSRGVIGLALLAATGVHAQPKPNEPALGWVPTPSFTSPASFQKFTLAPSLVVTLKTNIPKTPLGGSGGLEFDFVAYAKASPFVEKWHIKIVKQGPGGGPVPLQTFEGPVTGYQFGITLNADWFNAKGGPGKYHASAYLKQESPSNASGLATGVGFEIVAPVKMSDQKPGNVKEVPGILPPPAGGFVAPGPKPPGACGSVATQPKPPGAKQQDTQAPRSLPDMPDITSAATLSIGGVGGAWGGTINLNASQAFSKNLNNNALCEFPIAHTACNIGPAPTGAFNSVWKNSTVPGSWSRSWPPLAGGAAKTEKDLVSLKPGHNLLSLTLDNLHKVLESNESNNQFRVIVNLSGSCGAAVGIVPPPAGGGQPGAASTRVPAVQQPSRQNPPAAAPDKPRTDAPRP